MLSHTTIGHHKDALSNQSPITQNTPFSMNKEQDALPSAAQENHLVKAVEDLITTQHPAEMSRKLDHLLIEYACDQPSTPEKRDSFCMTIKNARDFFDKLCKIPMI